MSPSTGSANVSVIGFGTDFPAAVMKSPISRSDLHDQGGDIDFAWADQTPDSCLNPLPSKQNSYRILYRDLPKVGFFLPFGSEAELSLRMVRIPEIA